MIDDQDQMAPLDKLFQMIRFTIVAGLLGVALYFFGPLVTSSWDRKPDDAKVRNVVSAHALANVRNNGPSILNQAYPLAFGKLSYVDTELVGVGANGSGYRATIRLHYQNLLNRPHYLELAFEYDTQGGYLGSQFVKHTNIIAPKEFTLDTLVHYTQD